jgi:carbamoyl-phosphate synthase/aspartate carbamoyltransferase/dihydroorotase
MTVVRLPGLVDVHVHTRDPGQTHKETWASATAAALAGGITTVLAMPNTTPPVTDADSLAHAAAAAAGSARCDYALYAGATVGNAATVSHLAPRVAGLKLYLDQTFGDLRLPSLDAWWRHLGSWPESPPLVVHAEVASLGAVLLMAEWLDRSVHVCHVSRGDEIRLIARAKEHGVKVTCEATPHHLFLDQSDAGHLGGRGTVRPPLATPDDRQALWDHLAVIDCFATDHAPHTAAEKTAAGPPPGFPGLETMLPLLLDRVHQGALELDDVMERLDTNPRRIFGLSPADAIVEVDLDAEWVVHAADLHTACDWTPFEGRTLRGRVTAVRRGTETLFEEGRVLAAPGSGANLKQGDPSR